MNRTDAPKKQPVPFGVNGSREDLLPTTPAGDNQASYDAGFPPVTMILKAAGGLPPKGQDMNQILYELSAIGRWLMAGAINSYDAAFSTAIGGYPMGCEVLGDDGETIYFNTTESNTTNPNTGGAGWVVQNGDYQPINANLTALSGLAGAANRLPYFTGAGAMANTTLTAAGRELISKADVAAILTYLGLGDVVRDTRTINGKRLNADITLTAAELGIGLATEAVPGIVQISDAINANDSKVAASSAAVYKLLPKRVYAANDFIRIPDTPGGLMLQWGRLPSGEGINFPTPFTNNCLWCVVIPQSPSSGPFDMAYLYTRSFDRFGFLRSAATTATPCYWLAIGY